jgi:AraC family transcriptional activator FtrA
MLRLGLLLHPDMSLFEYAIVREAFCWPPATDWYSVTTLAERGGTVRTSSGDTFPAEGSIAELSDMDSVIVPGWDDLDRRPGSRLVSALHDAHRAGVRLVGLCTASYLFAYAGLLDGRRAATHWLYARDFQARFPAVRLDATTLFTAEDDLMTSAGAAAGIDLCLHLIAIDQGQAAASKVARRMVTAPHRRGGQAQFIPRPVLAVPGADPVAELLNTVADRVDEPWDLARMARVANVSERTLRRRIHALTGAGPMRYLLDQRLRRAQELLETTDIPVDTVARRSGFGTGERLRAHFRTTLGSTPTAYRSSFRGHRPAALWEERPA